MEYTETSEIFYSSGRVIIKVITYTDISTCSRASYLYVSANSVDNHKEKPCHLCLIKYFAFLTKAPNRIIARDIPSPFRNRYFVKHWCQKTNVSDSSKSLGIFITAWSDANDISTYINTVLIYLYI